MNDNPTDPQEQCKLAEKYGGDENASQEDLEKAVYWFKEAAEQGHALAQVNLGTHYKTGMGVAQNHKKAAFWWTVSASQDDPMAQFYLGICCMKGEGVPKNEQMGIYWITKAANQGLPHAQAYLRDRKSPW